MGHAACTEPQCLYNGALYFYLSIADTVTKEEEDDEKEKEKSMMMKVKTGIKIIQTGRYNGGNKNHLIRYI